MVLSAKIRARLARYLAPPASLSSRSCSMWILFRRRPTFCCGLMVSEAGLLAMVGGRGSTFLYDVASLWLVGVHAFGSWLAVSEAGVCSCLCGACVCIAMGMRVLVFLCSLDPSHQTFDLFDPGERCRHRGGSLADLNEERRKTKTRRRPR